MDDRQQAIRRYLPSIVKLTGDKMTLPDSEILTSVVGRVFRVEEITLGDPKKGYFLRYRGELTCESIGAYDQLAAALLAYDITPLFRIEDKRQTILLVRGTIHPKPGRAWVNVLLFVLTVLSVLFAGAVFSYSGPTVNDALGQIWTLVTHLWVGWPFAVSLLAILLAHEFGHYFVGRARGAAISLPYFIPLPFSPLGTMGAFIQMKQLPKNKRALFDLAIAGPLAGLVVAIPVLLFGLSRSTLSIFTAIPNSLAEGNSLLYLFAKFAVFGKLLPESPNLSGLPLLLHWISYFFIGQPSPVGSLDVMIDPVAWAGWAGLLVTFLNLIPAGQLDGGHVIYTVFDKRVNRIIPVILVATVLLGFFWSGWWLWAFLIFLLGRSHAEPLDQITQLDPSRKALAVLMLVIFLLVLMPVPLVTF
jgi:membrane-associated protease RseP (regulator of RpoE activity)